MVITMWIYMGAFLLAAWFVWRNAKQYDGFLQDVWEKRPDARPALRQFLKLPQLDQTPTPEQDTPGNADPDDI